MLLVVGSFQLVECAWSVLKLFKNFLCLPLVCLQLSCNLKVGEKSARSTGGKGDDDDDDEDNEHVRLFALLPYCGQAAVGGGGGGGVAAVGAALAFDSSIHFTCFGRPTSIGHSCRQLAALRGAQLGSPGRTRPWPLGQIGPNGRTSATNLGD